MEVVERVGDEVAVVAVGALAQQADQQPVQRERDLLVRGEEVEVVGDQPRQAVDQVGTGSCSTCSVCEGCEGCEGCEDWEKEGSEQAMKRKAACCYA